jgi:hypothetical protein
MQIEHNKITIHRVETVVRNLGTNCKGQWTERKRKEKITIKLHS